MLEKPNMEKDLVQLSPGDSLRKALNAFKNFKISHLPVIEDKNLVGIVTKSNVTEYLYKVIENFESESLESFLQKTTITQLMEKPVLTIRKNDELWDIVSQMEKEGVGSLVVKDNDTIVGIVTESDLLKVIREALDGHEKKSGAMLKKIKELLYDQDYMNQRRIFSEIGI